MVESKWTGRRIKMNKLKAKFNVEQIVNGGIIYGESFVELVMKYKDEIIEVEKEVFEGYELELEGGTYALSDKELIFIH